jgi:hypothetical protein
MDVRNLATVIAPNILMNPAKTLAMDSETIYVIDAVEILIDNIEEMCQVSIHIYKHGGISAAMKQSNINELI